MSEFTELVLKLRIAQLEGKLVLYENLVSDLSGVVNIQKVTADIKAKLKDISSENIG